jgi:lysophospholipase L1-like esterase
MNPDHDHGPASTLRPPEKLDYSLIGVTAQRAVELGIAEADLYQCPVPRATMRGLLVRRDGPAIRDTANTEAFSACLKAVSAAEEFPKKKMKQSMNSVKNVLKNSIILTIVFVLCAFTVQAGGNANIVVMLGDSTTECSLNKPSAKLVDYVQAYLAEQHLQARIVNSGIGSATAKIGLSQLQSAVLVHEPAVVTISFGLNDTGRSTPEEYRECLGKMVQSIQTNTHAKILLVTSTPFINERHQWRGQFTAKGGVDAALDTKFCSVMRLLAKDKNLPLCDLHAHFTAQFEKNPKLRDELILPDGVHLTDKGNAVAAKYVAPSIAGLLAKPGNNKKKGNAP